MHDAVRFKHTDIEEYLKAYDLAKKNECNSLDTSKDKSCPDNASKTNILNQPSIISQVLNFIP